MTQYYIVSININKGCNSVFLFCHHFFFLINFHHGRVLLNDRIRYFWLDYYLHSLFRAWMGLEFISLVNPNSIAKTPSPKVAIKLRHFSDLPLLNKIYLPITQENIYIFCGNASFLEKKSVLICEHANKRQ